MRKFLFFITVCAAITFVSLWLQKQQSASPIIPQHPRKIIALSPAIAETLIKLGLSDRIAGVTEHTPQNNGAFPIIGKFRELNMEAILMRKPDLVILPADMGHFKRIIESANLPVLLFDSGSLSGFLQSACALGQLFGKDTEAEKLAMTFQGGETGRKNPPRLLFALLNPEDCLDRPAEINIIGNDGFYNALLEKAGAINAYQGPIPYPRLTPEGIASLQPQLILAATPQSPLCANPETSLRKWLVPPDGKLAILNDPALTIPGPSAGRTFGIIKDLVAQVCHD